MKPKFSQIPTLSGRKVHLRPIEEQDIYTLWEWASDPEEIYLWRSRRTPVSLEIFKQELQSMVQDDLLHLIVEEKENKNIIGWIYAYGISSWEHRIFVSLYIVAQARKTLAAQEAGMILFDYLFSYIPLRKIAAEVYSYNEVSLRFLQSAGFVVEGNLREERYFAGHYYDIVRLSILASEWPEIRKKVKESIDVALVRNT